MKERLLASVRQDRRKWLEGKLYNEPSLKERLDELATTPDAEVMKRLLPNPKAWAKDTALARNDIAHRGRSDQKRMKYYSPVVHVTTAVVILNILHRLKIPNDRILWALNDNATLSRAVRLSAEHWPSPTD